MMQVSCDSINYKNSWSGILIVCSVFGRGQSFSLPLTFPSKYRKPLFLSGQERNHTRAFIYKTDRTLLFVLHAVRDVLHTASRVSTHQNFVWSYYDFLLVKWSWWVLVSSLQSSVHLWSGLQTKLFQILRFLLWSTVVHLARVTHETCACSWHARTHTYNIRVSNMSINFQENFGSWWLSGSFSFKRDSFHFVIVKCVDVCHFILGSPFMEACHPPHWLPVEWSTGQEDSGRSEVKRSAGWECQPACVCQYQVLGRDCGVRWSAWCEQNTKSWPYAECTVVNIYEKCPHIQKLNTSDTISPSTASDVCHESLLWPVHFTPSLVKNLSLGCDVLYNRAERKTYCLLEERCTVWTFVVCISHVTFRVANFWQRQRALPNFPMECDKTESKENPATCRTCHLLPENVFLGNWTTDGSGSNYREVGADK